MLEDDEGEKKKRLHHNATRTLVFLSVVGSFYLCGSLLESTTRCVLVHSFRLQLCCVVPSVRNNVPCQVFATTCRARCYRYSVCNADAMQCRSFVATMFCRAECPAPQ